MSYGIRILLLMIAAIVFAGNANAQSETDRLRDALRSATAQTRALEDQRTALQAKVSEVERERALFKTQIDAAKADAAKVERDYRQAVQDFNARLEDRNQTLEKWKEAYEEAATVARTKDAERAKFESESKNFKASTKSCVGRNIELVKVGRELLNRYDDLTIGDIIVAREPLIGLRRVEIQNLLQDYRDKVLDQRVQQ